MGSTTAVVIKALGVFPLVNDEETKKFLASGLHVIARNDPPYHPCSECPKKGKAKVTAATHLCGDCGAKYMCKKHSKSHECEQDSIAPLVNSPRAGVCGYTG